MSSQFNDLLTRLGLNGIFGVDDGVIMITPVAQRIIYEICGKERGCVTNELMPIYDLLKDISVAMKCSSVSQECVDEIAKFFLLGEKFLEPVDTIYVSGYKIPFRSLYETVEKVLTRYDMSKLKKVFIIANSKLKSSKEDRVFFKKELNGFNSSCQVSMMEFAIDSLIDKHNFTFDVEIFEVGVAKKYFNLPVCEIKSCKDLWSFRKKKELLVFEKKWDFFPLSHIIRASEQNKERYVGKKILLVDNQPNLLYESLRLLEMSYLHELFPSDIQIYAGNFYDANILQEFQRILSILVNMQMEMDRQFDILRFPF